MTYATTQDAVNDAAEILVPAVKSPDIEDPLFVAQNAVMALVMHKHKALVHILGQLGYSAVIEAAVKAEKDKEESMEIADSTRTRIRLERLTDAADEVEYCFNRYKNAESILDQANALLMLSDAVFEMAKYLPGYNNLTGGIERP